MLRKARLTAIRVIIETDHLEALFLTGDTNVGPHLYGDLRYYTDNRIIFYRQVVVIFPQFEPALFAGSETGRQEAAQRFSMKDCRPSENIPPEVAKFLKERSILIGRVSVN